MKKLIIAASILGCTFTAHADTWRTRNNNGGYIILTERDCAEYPNKGFRSGYSYGNGGSTLSFCWIIIDGMVRAVYKDGSQYTYNPANFEKVQAGRQG